MPVPLDCELSSLPTSGETYRPCLDSSTECFGIHIGNPQSANLGDGNGWVNQTYELREDYGDADVGTCLESAIGGDHFRWVGVASLFNWNDQRCLKVCTAKMARRQTAERSS